MVKIVLTKNTQFSILTVDMRWTVKIENCVRLRVVITTTKPSPNMRSLKPASSGTVEH